MKIVVLACCLTSGCYVSADVASIEQTLAAQSFTGAGVSHAGSIMTETKDLNLNLGKSVLRVLTELDLTRITFSPASGISKIDFISELTLTAQGTTGVTPLPDAVIARFAAGMPIAANGGIDAEVMRVDVVPYLQQGLPFRLTVTAFAPSADWSLGIDIVLHAESDGKIDP